MIRKKRGPGKQAATYDSTAIIKDRSECLIRDTAPSALTSLKAKPTRK